MFFANVGWILCGEEKRIKIGDNKEQEGVINGECGTRLRFERIFTSRQGH
jgi:hypothetical protein